MMVLREKIIGKVLQKKVIAIVRGLYDESVLKLAEALLRGGIEIMEITFDQLHPENHAATTKAVYLLNERMGDRMLIGAGTVTSDEMVENAYSAGAQFLVSPNVTSNLP
jgi:2-dehydro-3-deoxyphosphogluconate aldolase/(4S)-4-hydroxy-2-oxoglutarate aldolase